MFKTIFILSIGASENVGRTVRNLRSGPNGQTKENHSVEPRYFSRFYVCS